MRVSEHIDRVVRTLAGLTSAAFRRPEGENPFIEHMGSPVKPYGEAFEREAGPSTHAWTSATVARGFLAT